MTAPPITGRFTGVLTVGRDRLTGTWTAADGTHTLPVSLHAVAQYITVTATKRRVSTSFTLPHFLSQQSGLEKIVASLRVSAINNAREFRNTYGHEDARCADKQQPARYDDQDDARWEIRYYFISAQPLISRGLFYHRHLRTS